MHSLDIVSVCTIVIKPCLKIVCLYRFREMARLYLMRMQRL